MYLITIQLIVIALLYRQFVLGQNSEQFSDLANILVFNTVFLLAMVLYLGGIPFPALSFKKMLLIYLGFIILGFAFTMFKYGYMQNVNITAEFALEKLFIVGSILALLTLIYVIFAWFGKKRLEKEIS